MMTLPWTMGRSSAPSLARYGRGGGSGSGSGSGSRSCLFATAFTTTTTTTFSTIATRRSIATATTRSTSAARAVPHVTFQRRQRNGHSQQQQQRQHVHQMRFQSSSSSTSSSSSGRPPSYMTQLFGGPPQQEERDPGVVEGTDLQIVKYPHPALRAPNEEISIDELLLQQPPQSPTQPPTNNTSSSSSSMLDVHQLVRNMFKIMYAANGVGLAAPQVGINRRLMVYNPTGDPQRWMDETVWINPTVVDQSQATDVETEGCLSFPGMSGDVVRHKWIKVEGYTLKGKKRKKKYSGWEARIFQHEYDHLDGTVYIDRLTEESRPLVEPRLQQLIQEYGDGGVL